MSFGAIVIGHEILVGKRQDKHPSFAIKRSLRADAAAWAGVSGDDPQRLTAALKRSFARGEIVFSFGGIGATPDDHTRRCTADALGVALSLHPDAEREIRGRFGAEITPQRLRMGEFPAGCEIIPNPFNRIPGFMIREHHFVPGFPQMAWPMIEWVLDTRYRHLFDRDGQRPAHCLQKPESMPFPRWSRLRKPFTVKESLRRWARMHHVAMLNLACAVIPLRSRRQSRTCADKCAHGDFRSRKDQRKLANWEIEHGHYRDDSHGKHISRNGHGWHALAEIVRQFDPVFARTPALLQVP
jgi:molybdopterin-biosynthesis enzyme MoeA-like protein